MFEANKQIWQSLGIKQSDTALFFPVSNVLLPLRFAKFMNKRKVTFADTNGIFVSTLISLAAEMKMSNVTVKLAGLNGKFPIADSAFEFIYSDLGFSSFLQDHGVDVDALTKELIRMLKSSGRIAALDENGAPVMYPCPPEIQTIRSKIDGPRADRLVMGRRIYGAFKANGLKNVRVVGYSTILTSDDGEDMNEELSLRIAALDSHSLAGQFPQKGGTAAIATNATPQEIEKYRAWLKSQLENDSFMIQFNTILTIGEK